MLDEACRGTRRLGHRDGEYGKRLMKEATASATPIVPSTVKTCVFTLPATRKRHPCLAIGYIRTHIGTVTYLLLAACRRAFQ